MECSYQADRWAVLEMYVAAPGMRRQTRMEHICHALTDRQICFVEMTGIEKQEAFALS